MWVNESNSITDLNLPLVSETKMVDVGKLISLRNLLVRKVTWFMLTTTSEYLEPTAWQGLPIYTWTHSLTFWLPKTALSPFSFRLPETAWSGQLVRHSSICVTWVCIHSATFFFPVLPFWLDFFQLQTQPQKFCQTPKETNNQHGRRHVPPRIYCYISVYWYPAWNT